MQAGRQEAAGKQAAGRQAAGRQAAGSEQAATMAVAGGWQPHPPAPFPLSSREN